MTTTPFFEKMVTDMGGVLNELLPGWQADPSTQDTAKRFVKYLLEYRTPLDVEKIFGSTFVVDGTKDHGMVVQTNIPFRGVCEHHLLPMYGKAHLAYIPVKALWGLSKFARLVEGVGLERPSLQEYMGQRMADLMNKHLQPRGVAVHIESEHTCMSCRGVATPGVVTKSTHLFGVFEKPEVRAEFFSQIR